MALAASGQLSMWSAAGAGRNVSAELYGSTNTSKSFATMLADAEKASTAALTSFYSFNGTPQMSTASAVETGGTVDVSFSGTEADNHLQYDIERDVNGGGFSAYASNVTSVYNDASVSFGSTYTYRVVMRTTAGRTDSLDTNSVTIGA